MATEVTKSLRDRGFGFIGRDKASGASDLFFHQSSVADNGFERLREGQPVIYDEEADPRDRTRQRAVNVRHFGDDGA